MRHEPIPRRIIGNDAIDPWRDEMMRSLFDGRARYKVKQQSDESNKPKITLPSGYEPAYLR